MTKGFILYQDYREHFDNMQNDAEKVELLNAIFDYHKDGETKKLSPVVKATFAFIRKELERQKEKYIEVCERNKKNSKNAGRPKNQNNPKESKEIQINPVDILEIHSNPENPITKNKEQIINTKEEIKKEGTASDADQKDQKLFQKYEILKTHEYFKNSDFSEKWEIFNKQKGKKATIDSKIMGLNKLFRFSLEESITALENSICSGWTGVFPKKGENKFSNGQNLNKQQRNNLVSEKGMLEIEESKKTGKPIQSQNDLSWLAVEKEIVPKQISTI